MLNSVYQAFEPSVSTANSEPGVLEICANPHQIGDTTVTHIPNLCFSEEEYKLAYAFLILVSVRNNGTNDLFIVRDRHDTNCRWDIICLNGYSFRMKDITHGNQVFELTRLDHRVIKRIIWHKMGMTEAFNGGIFEVDLLFSGLYQPLVVSLTQEWRIAVRNDPLSWVIAVMDAYNAWYYTEGLNIRPTIHEGIEVKWAQWSCVDAGDCVNSSVVYPIVEGLVLDSASQPGNPEMQDDQSTQVQSNSMSGCVQH